MIPHSRPLLGPEEAEAAKQVVLSGMLAEGPQVEAFERELARFLKVRRCAGVAHGTGALHLALLAMGAGPGKSVILPSYSCVSLLNSVTYTGARPVLVDCHRDVPDLELDQVVDRWDGQTVAVVIPHLFGRAVDFERLPHPTVEDATHSLGAIKPHGPCVFSFYATKMLAGGEGGAVANYLPELDRAVRDRRSYDGRSDWIPRFNYKMTDLAAAILRVQLRRFPGFLQRRREIAAFYRRELAHLDLMPPQPGEANYRFVLRVPWAGRVMRRLNQRGIGARPPVHRPIHTFLDVDRRHFQNAHRWWRRAVSIPCYPSLSDAEVEEVVRVVREVV